MHFARPQVLTAIENDDSAPGSSSSHDGRGGGHPPSITSRRYFQEMGLFLDRGSRLTARALSHVDLFTLARDAFEAALAESPDSASNIADRAKDCTRAHPAILQTQSPPGRFRVPARVSPRRAFHATMRASRLPCA